MYISHLHKEPFEQIAAGLKTLEARIFDEKRRQLKVGDRLQFINRSNESELLLARITNLYNYSSFEAMFRTLGVVQFGYEPGTSPFDAARSMRRYYALEEEEEHGVVGIELSV